MAQGLSKKRDGKGSRKCLSVEKEAQSGRGQMHGGALSLTFPNLNRESSRKREQASSRIWFSCWLSHPQYLEQFLVCSECSKYSCWMKSDICRKGKEAESAEKCHMRMACIIKAWVGRQYIKEPGSACSLNKWCLPWGQFGFAVAGPSRTQVNQAKVKPRVIDEQGSSRGWLFLKGTVPSSVPRSHPQV